MMRLEFIFAILYMDSEGDYYVLAVYNGKNTVSKVLCFGAG